MKGCPDEVVVVVALVLVFIKVVFTLPNKFPNFGTLFPNCGSLTDDAITLLPLKLLVEVLVALAEAENKPVKFCTLCPGKIT